MNNEEVTYLIQQGNYLKIGYTSNLKNRLKQYDTHNMYYKLLYVINGNCEKELHEKFKKYKEKTEWFKYNDEIIEYFKNRNTENEVIKSVNSVSININSEWINKIEQISEYKVLLWCLEFSNNNLINLNIDILNKIQNKTEYKIQSIRNTIVSLVKKDLLIKDKTKRGIYYLNKKYFWKGKISDITKNIDLNVNYNIDRDEAIKRFENENK